MTQYGFHFNGERCTGCKACVMACKDVKDLGCDLAFRQVYEYAGGEWAQDETGLWSQDVYTYYISAACQHCANPACMAACEKGAIVKDEQTGLVLIDSELCDGCGNCALACPYGAPVISPATGKAVKCDGCYDRVAAGLLPVCVEACPRRALDFGPIDELRETYGDVAGVAPLPDPSLTDPSLVITPHHNSRPCDDTTGAVANDRELVR